MTSMERIVRRSGHVAAPAALVLALAACASQPPAELQQAQQSYQQAKQDQQVSSNAPVALHEAEQQLQQAQQAWKKDKGDKEVQHQAYLAEQRVAIARAKAQDAAAQKQIKQLGDERQQVLLSAREQQAQQAQKRADLARMEAQRLQSELSDVKAKAKQTEGAVVLTLGDVLFGLNKAALKPGVERNLQPLAQFLDRHPQRKVIIEGYTDSTGPNAYNQKLSEQRAESVKQFLVRNGIGADRVITKGYGEQYPVAPNSNAAGRQQNRRVQVVILDQGEQASAHMR